MCPTSLCFRCRGYATCRGRHCAVVGAAVHVCAAQGCAWLRRSLVVKRRTTYSYHPLCTVAVQGAGHLKEDTVVEQSFVCLRGNKLLGHCGAWYLELCLEVENFACLFTSVQHHVQSDACVRQSGQCSGLCSPTRSRYTRRPSSSSSTVRSRGRTHYKDHDQRRHAGAADRCSSSSPLLLEVAPRGVWMLRRF